MENRLILIVFLTAISLNSWTQVVKSEKSSIHINTKKETEVSDSDPPVVTIMSPNISENGWIESTSEEINLIGSVEDASEIKTLFINGKITDLAENNIFLSEISLGEGENEVSIVAMDEFGNLLQKSYNVRYTPQLVFRTLDGKGQYYALLIGINEYLDQNIADLDNPVQDAEKLYETLISDYTFDKEDVILLKNARR